MRVRKRFAKLLQRLTVAADRMVGGDLSQRVEVLGKLEQKTARLNALNRMSCLLTSSPDLSYLFDALVQMAAELLQGSVAILWVLEEGAKEVVLTASFGIRYWELRGRNWLKVGEGLAGWVVQTKKPLLIRDCSEDPRSLCHTWFRAEGLRGSVGAPLLVGERCLGALFVFRTNLDPFTEEDLDLLGTLAAQAAIAIENARLCRMVVTAKQEWESIFDAVADPIYIHSADYRILRANRAFAEWVGLPFSQVIGRRCHELFAGLDYFCPCHPSDQAAESKRPITNELRDPRTGKIYWVMASSARNPGGEICCFVHVARDITRRKQAEEALQESEERLQAILDNTTAVIYVKDTQGRYMLINRRYEVLFHVTREEIKGKTDYDLFPRGMADAFRANDQRVLVAKAPLEFEEVVLQDNELHTYISIKFPLHDSGGVPYAVCGISTDITERKRAEEQLQARNRELLALYEQVERDRAVKATLLKELNHRVRNNLAAIIGILQMELGRADKRTTEEALSSCLERVKAITTAHELLAASDLVSLDLQAVLEAVISGVIGGKKEDALKLEVSIQGPSLKLPPKEFVALACIVHELVENAVRHAFKGRERGRVGVRVWEEDGCYILEVRDDGVGFAGGTRASEGLGLEVVQTLCRADLCGDCRFLQDGGTVVRISFPRPVNDAGG